MLCLRRVILYGLLISFSHCLLIHAQGPGPGSEARNPSYSRNVDMRVQFEVQEGLPNGTWVGRIPTKPGFTYRFNENQEQFILNGSTGEIRTNKVIDREALKSDRFDLVVLSSQPTYPVEVRITILDINDNAPAFPEPIIPVTFSENANPGTRVFLDTAEDRDTGINDVTTEYKIIEGNEDGQFHVAVTTNPSGEAPFLHLETTGKLDREIKSFYTLNISAQDGGEPPKYGYLLVNVTITDINDCAPRFDMSDYVVSLNESVPIGTGVLQVTATDNDDGDNAQITYYLAETETQFSVDPDSGIISTMQTLNCPQNCPQQTTTCTKSCVFTVFARDHGVPRQDGRTYVTVNLLDANDHDPLIKFRYFPPTASAATVDENAQNGSVVAAISVVDMDEGPNGETVVTIVSGNELEHFRLESTPSFQLVRVNGVLDREKIGKYNLSIIATDNGSPRRSSAAFLIIEVNDINDHEPVFEKSEYSAVLRELVPVGTYVASITASDEDTGINSQVFYSIEAGNEKMWFNIDSVSGLLTTRALLDREQQDTVRLKISARDGGPNPKWAHAQIKITIMDDNDERPVFTNTNVRVTLSEDAPPGSLVAVLSASDHDQGTNGSVVYYLSPETENSHPGLFNIDASTGKLVSRARFDRETLSSYDIILIAKDQGNPPLSSTATVHLSITDVNDHDPQIYPVEYFVTAPEDTPVGSTIVQVLAKDPDEGPNAAIKMSIESGAEGLFAIEESTGKITLKNELRASKRKMFQLKVSATDGGGRKSAENAMVEVLIKSFDEQILKFRQELFQFNITEDTGLQRISEGKDVGKIDLESSKSGDKGQIRFSIIEGDPQGIFNIDESTGMIRAVKSVDREVKENYMLSVLARHGLAYGSCKVAIHVSDLNDNAPIFAKKRVMTEIDENSPVGCDVYLVEAKDPDEGNNAKITYSLTHNPDHIFSIDASNGLVSLNKPLRFSSDQSELNIEVMAIDGAPTPLSSKQHITLVIKDTNDHTPIFHLSSYETSLLETTSVNSRFFALQATDQDSGPNAQISYEIVDGNADEKFGVFPDGYLYVKANLDREEQDYFSLTVLAKDSGIPQRSSTVSVVIHVIDENDNSPKFTNATFTFFVAENESPDTYIGKVTATDDDVGRNAELTYSLSSAQNEFIVDPKNGFIKNLKSFDREQLLQSTGQDFVSLEVVVQDGGAIRLKDKATIIIYITDVNDNKPTFVRSSYSAQVSEGAPVGSQVVRVIASDFDEGLNGDIVYYLGEGNTGEVFKVDATTGQISLAKLLDRESQDKYTLTVIAEDTAEINTLSSSTTVVVDVLDENDNMPEFTQSESRVSILETTPVNTEIIRFQASDPDVGLNQQVTMSITGGNRHDSFRIDAKTGSLYLNKMLDFERYSSYTLNITASDSGNPRLSSSVQFLVTVQDVNDNPPIFPSTAIVRQIQEGIAKNTPIVTVSAEDPDSGLNGKVKYSIKEQEPGGDHFGIDPDLGTIHTLKAIDREFTDTFRLTVVATDKAIPVSSRLSAEKLVTVIVEDVNDNEPHFTSMNAAVIMKNSDKSREIIRVKAVDLDSESNGVVTYEMISGDMSLFKLDRTSGSLTVKRPVSEVQPRYQLTIRATDEAIQSQRKSSDLYLSLIGISDNSHLGGLAFNQSTYKGSIFENEPVGSSILTVFTTLDDKSPSDDLDIEYYITSISSASNAEAQDRLFEIDLRRGILSSAVVLDREMGVHHFVVQVYAIVVSSKGLNTAATKIEIEILDRNDSPPKFPSKVTELSVSENAPVGQQLASLTATDADTLGTISYSIVSGDEGKFDLESSTGILRIRDSLDREENEEYLLVVKASDGIQDSSAKVRVTLVDENDNAPRWTESAYSFDIPEDAPHGYKVGSLQAMDPDKGANAHITYSVLSDWGNDVFSLNPQTGIFTLSTRLDYEDVQHYIFVVQAQDTGRPSLSSTTTVYLNVMDINDNAPTFDPMSYNREVYENITIGSSVVAVSATDLDSGLNGKITYSIISDNDNDVFGISDNGTIFTKQLLDRETKAYYNLIVEASDSSESKPMSSTVQVNIALEDINDCAPDFISPNETFVMENSPMNTVILLIKAVDKDEGRNSYVEYTLNNEKNTFSLGPVDGLLRISGLIDRETTNSYILKITAKDRGEPSKASSQNLLVKVKDYNDNAPSFDPRQYSSVIPENSSVGMSVLQVSATDIDEGMNAQVRYTIVAGDPNRDFSIGEDSGVLRLAKSLNYERKRSYSLTVQAEDSGEQVRYDTATISISVTDCNDNPPVFLDSPYLAFVRENMVEIPATVLRVNAYDADTATNNHQVRYLMKDGDKGSFRVNTSTGEITVHRALDREQQSEFLLTVVAMDTGTPRLSGTGMVRVVVQDQNDNSPFFPQDHYVFLVDENVVPGTVAARVVAVDMDTGLNAKIRYTIEGKAGGPFEMNQDTGEIITRGQIDRELQDVYHLTVEASDSSPVLQRRTTVQVQIIIQDKNDNAPQFNNARYSVKIPDDTATGGYVLGVSAVDIDAGLNSVIRYYLGGADADKFQINQNTGVIKSLRNLNKSGNTQFHLEIHATDSSPKEPLSSSVNVEVNLVSTTKFPKIKLSTNSFTFSENVSNEVVTTVEGISADMGRDIELLSDNRERSLKKDKKSQNKFNFFIGGGNLGDAFLIDSESGQVKISPNGLDYEIAQNYELWIEVSKVSEPELRSAVALYINITDSNDNKPKFEFSMYNLSVPEEEPGPRLIATLQAKDIDSGDNGRIMYQLSKESASLYSNLFGIQPDTGELFSKVKLDREEILKYTLSVEAVDLGSPPQIGTTIVVVNVQDKNDNPPRFTRLFSVNVTENVPMGTFVIQVTSVDKDVGENANCTYSFTENPHGKFKIDTFSGNVTVSGMLDRETQDEYLLKVAAIDGSWRAETLVTITIQDVNDNAPEFEHSYYSFNIPEGDRPVTFVGQVAALDRDKRGPNSMVSYGLKQPSDFFSVDPVSGEIFSKKRIKYKPSWKKFSPENEYSLLITATDSGKPPMSSECTININVVDGNNHAPRWEKQSYFTPVLETSSVGQRILHMKAVDADDFGVNSELEYLKIGGNGTELFNIEKETGWIVVVGDLKGRKSQRYVMQLRVMDKGIPPQSDDVQVSLMVSGPNNHTPVFSALSYRVIVPENEALGTVIVTVSASDEDSGPNGQILYNITKGNEQKKFLIDVNTGAVSINKDLDFDTKKEYHLNISARDLGYHSRSSEAELTVILTDINDNPPQFPKTLYTGYVNENSPLNTEVLKLEAVDIDSPKNSIIRYSIVGGSGKNYFSISPETGVISTKKVFDYEERDEYSLEILASNPDSNLYGTTKVQARILGVNEYYPKFVQPVFHFTVSESAVIGSVIGNVQTTDEDSGEDGIVFYLFVGSSNDRGFIINTNTGAITISRRLDRESQSRIVLTVLAKNQGSIRGNDTDEAQIIITVQDGNDPPVFEKEIYQADISEGAPIGTRVVAVKATDIDVRPSNNRFSYEIISGNDNKTFKIDPISGLILTSTALDRETVPLYTFVVGAIDMGQPPQTGTTTVQINLLDVNDNGPTLDATSMEGSILENEPPNTKVLTLHATDFDLSPNGEPFSYALVGGPDVAKFKVDPKSGHVTSTVSFDREATPELRILVEITDNGSPPMKSRQEVKILVLDKNDCPSQPRNGQVILYTFKDNLPKEKVASVEPIDPDVVGQYSCRLEKNEKIFKIQSNCNLLVETLPAYKRQSLKILADDGNHAEVSSTMLVEFFSFDNATMDNSIIIRAVGVEYKKVLEKSYLKLLSFFRPIMRHEPHIYGLIPNVNGTDIIVASGSGNQYMSPDDLSALLLSHKGHLENLLDGTVIINHSPCATQNICQNGAACTQSLRAYSTPRISESPLLVLSAPSVFMEFSCQCPSGFLGFKCQLRREPCQPNPCEAGAVCSKQGYDFHCACPAQRYGKRCELERSSACESNPCKNGGSCQENPQDDGYFCLCRPGFFGNQCQTVSDACRPNPCLNGGECIGNVAPNSAFPRCKCRTHFYGRHCEKSSFGFAFGSFMSFPSLDSNTNDISIIFSSNKKDSLLVYNYGEQTGGRSDFVAIQLVSGKPVLSYGGSRTAIATLSVDRFVADGQWHRIIATRNSRVISLSVSSCEDSGESCHDCKHGDATCYADDVGPTGTLNFNGNPLIVGGLMSVEPMLERPDQVQADDFIGCIHSLTINGRLLNMTAPLEQRSVSATCQRVMNVCEPSSMKCGQTGQCIDLWDSYTCRCNGVIAPNCFDAFAPYTFAMGSFMEFRVGEKYRRSQLLQNTYLEQSAKRVKRQVVTKTISFRFRTVQNDAILFYAASDKDYTVIELENGDLKFSSRIGSNYPIQMNVPDLALIDGQWHTVKLAVVNKALQLLVDGERRGEELNSASGHDFLDPYLTTMTLGGLHHQSINSNKVYSAFTGCMSNFSINDELQPLNGSGSMFDEVIHYGKISRGCSSALAGAATAPDPLSIGVTLVIVFFVILLVAISVSFVVFRLRKREKNPLPPLTPTTKQSPSSQTTGDVVRSHVLDGEAEAIRNLVRNSKKLTGSNTGYQKPDIIERTTSTPTHNGAGNSPTNNGMLNSGNGISMEPELSEMPEHYDLENASSIAPSDIDIVYHYKGFRDNLGGRSKSSPFRHNHHFSGSHQSPGIRQSPISNVLKSTPLARLSPSSELSQQTTPRILTLQDISGKPLQSALLATTQKDTMSQSERSLNISHSSSRSSIVNASSQGTKKKRKKCGGDGGNKMTIGLTAEEIERLNNSRHKNNSSLVSTLDAVSSSESDDRRKNKMTDLLETNTEIMQRARDTSSDEDESGNDSFTCSEFEYDNEKRDFRPSHMIFSKLTEVENEEGEDSFRGSLSTLVASDDDLSYINSYSKTPNPNDGSTSMGWDYLLNWGPNFENLVGVFKDIAELPDCAPGTLPNITPSSGINSIAPSSRSSRYPTPRPSEEYV